MRHALTHRPRSRVLTLLAAAAVTVPALAGLTTGPQPASASPAPSTSTATGSAGVRPAAASAVAPRWEVWQTPEQSYAENPTNPLAKRRWGVYDGPQDQVWKPYQAATGAAKALIGKIAERPRTKWFGSWVADGAIKDSVRRYIDASQDGDRSKLVQLAVFRMKPWEHTACTRRATPAEEASYRRWITNLAAGIGSTPALVVMQPDGPFLWCVPDRAATGALLTFATKTLSALPHTSVYIDGGAADWCENGHAADPERCAGILERTGIRYARGFALDSSHYTGPVDNIRLGSKMVSILRRDGYGTKHFILDTAKSGRPMHWGDVIPAKAGGLKDNARTCSTLAMRRCVTLGIPPTVRVAARRWGMGAAVRQLAARNVDGFVWFGRPWLYNQADPFVKARALDMGRTTPWPGPKAGTPPQS